jgi:hypothetical protein
MLNYPLFNRVFDALIISRLYRILPFKMHSISHHFSDGFDNNDIVDEEGICQDIFIFYQKFIMGIPGGLGNQSGVWGDILNKQSSLANILNSSDSTQLAKYLNSAPSNAIGRGVLQGDLETKLLQRSRKYRNLAAKITRRRIEAVLEAQGYKSILNPEQGQWEGIGEKELASMLSDFEHNLDCSLSPPNIFAGLFEISLGAYRFNQVDLMSLNSALAVRRVMSDKSLQRIVEIGGGSGRFAYYCLKLGLGPIYIIDLPHVLILQYWYLSKALPASKIRFNHSSDSSSADIVLVPNSKMNSIDSKQIEMVFNQDSFAEMPTDIVKQYLDWIALNKDSLIFSINHESKPFSNYGGEQQINIFEVLSSDNRFKLLSRELDWVRRGYVRSIFRVEDER